MNEPQSTATSSTLLGRLRLDPPDPAAWDAFVRRYGPIIHAWCRQRRLQEASAQDVTQNVFRKLVVRLRTFAYDRSRSFRGWLKTVTTHAVQDYWDDQDRAGRGRNDSAALDALRDVEAREDLARRLGEEFDLELLEAAKARVKQRVQPHTWEVFRLLTEENIGVEEVAKRLDMQVATVFVTRSKVKKMLREEIAKLDQSDDTM